MNGNSDPEDQYHLLWRDLLLMKQANGEFWFKNPEFLSSIVEHLLQIHLFDLRHLILIRSLSYCGIFNHFVASKSLKNFVLSGSSLKEQIYSLVCLDPILHAGLAPLRQPQPIFVELSGSGYPCFSSLEEAIRLGSTQPKPVQFQEDVVMTN